MIHLNLIEAAERSSLMENVNPVHVTDVRAARKSSKSRLLTIGVAAAFAVVAFSCFLSVFGVPAPLQGTLPEAYLSLIGAEDPSNALTLGAGQTTTAGGLLEAEAAAERAVLKMREGMTVHQVVGEINPKALYNNNRTNFESYLPLEKMSFQKAASAQFLTFLTTATPDDVGFSDCIFQTPNYFYIRGVAAKPTSQRSFLERLKSVSADFRTPPLPENAPATDITAFGLFNVSTPNLTLVTNFVKSAEVTEEVKALKAIATNAKLNLKGLEKPAVEDFGVYKRYTYTVSANSDFPELQNFASGLLESPVRVGIKKIELAFAKRDIQSSMQLVMFVVP
ncbi:MAG: hypothetical protein IKS02_07690 [Fibrobacter sp.]|nr:hypothetical protein [Fibrobacter sp.]